MAGYYKTIKGKDYDRELLESAEKMVKGRGDGRISLADAKRLIAVVRDTGNYTDLEKRTMAYIRDHFSFTADGDKWFRTEIRKWAAMKGANTVKKPVKKAAPKVKAKPKAAVVKKAAPKAKAKAVAVKKAAPKTKARPKAATVRNNQRNAPSPGERLAAINRDEPQVQAPREERSKPGSAPKKRSGWNIILILLLISIIIIIIVVANKRCGTDTTMTGDKAIEDRTQSIETIKTDKDTAPIQEAVTKVKEEAAPAKVLEKSDEYDIYTVGVKESLVGISEKETGNYRNWPKIFKANRDIISDPKLIFPGQQIRIPKK